jgi:hypothetical protein
MDTDNLENQYAHIIRHLPPDQVVLVESEADVSYSPKLQRAREVFSQLQQQKEQQQA